MTISKEQLTRIIESADDVITALAGTNEDCHRESDDMIRLWDYLNDVAAPPAIVKKLAEMALAGMEAEPVLYASEETLAYAKNGELHLRCLSQPMGDCIIPLHAAPQPLTTSERAELENYRNAQQVVPDEKVIGTFDAEKNELALLDKNMTVEKFAHWHVHNSLEVIVRPIRAAMLQGAEPVSNRDRLPLDYLQGHKDGLEWAALLAEANHPQTGDWLYDDPLELAKAIRKGPDMPGSDGTSPVIPDGWVMVPEEPTHEMLEAGDEQFGTYDVYRRMLAAAPQQE